MILENIFNIDGMDLLKNDKCDFFEINDIASKHVKVTMGGKNFIDYIKDSKSNIFDQSQKFCIHRIRYHPSYKEYMPWKGVALKSINRPYIELYLSENLIVNNLAGCKFCILAIRGWDMNGGYAMSDSDKTYYNTLLLLIEDFLKISIEDFTDGGFAFYE